MFKVISAFYTTDFNNGFVSQKHVFNNGFCVHEMIFNNGFVGARKVFYDRLPCVEHIFRGSLFVLFAGHIL